MPHQATRPDLLHPFQQEAIDLLKSRVIHLALTAPTGSGKGVILEILALDPRERILLLTPLIALGRQQLQRFVKRGTPCHTTIGGKPCSELNSKRTRVWISSPEAAFSPHIFRRIQEWKPTLVAVDEAHCLQEWGESFRPAYRKIPDFIKTLGTSRTLWMSATLPKATIEELRRILPGNWEVRGKFAMPHSLEIMEKKISYSTRVETVRHSALSKNTSGIVFAGTRKNVENYASLFRQEGARFLAYHAGMSDEERKLVESNIDPTRDTTDQHYSLVATNAFGMGMDYSHLEWVIMAQAPFSLLGLMQSLGRVARGARKGHAEIYWAEEDFRMAGYLIRDKKPESRESRDLDLLRRYLMADSTEKSGLLTEVFL